MNFKNFGLFLGLILSLTQSISSDTNWSESRLIKTSQTEPAQWMTKDQMMRLIKRDQGFMDITDQLQNLFETITTKPSIPIPKILRFQPQTIQAQSRLNMNRAEKYLQNLTKFHTRFFTTQSGLDAAVFIKDHLTNIANQYNGSVTVDQFKHLWRQPSLILRIQGTTYPDQIVVLGSHLDSINYNDLIEGRSPGADDDGTGTAALIEIFQVLIESGFKPRRTLEFHFYSAEEVGLLGSQAVANKYKEQGKDVVAMLQLDMAGYRPSDVNTIKLIRDYTSPTMSAFLKLLINTYSKYQAKEANCGFACSDHASWHLAGYRSSFIWEEVKSKNYHTANDSIDDIDFDYLLQFAKVAAAFSIELGEPSE